MSTSTGLFLFDSEKIIMPAWATIYLLLYFLTVVGGAWYVSRLNFATHLLAMDALSSVILAYLFCGYWIPQIVETIGWGAPIGLVVALGWTIYSWKKVYTDPKFLSRVMEEEEARRDHSTEESSEITTEQLHSATRASLWVTAFCNLPAYVFGALAVWKWLQ